MFCVISFYFICIKAQKNEEKKEVNDETDFLDSKQTIAAGIFQVIIITRYETKTHVSGGQGFE